MNIASVVFCGGDHEKAPDFMQEYAALHKDICALGICGSRDIDCKFFFVFMIVTGTCVFLSIHRVARRRQESTSEIREMTNVLVQQKKKQAWKSLSMHVVQIAKLGGSVGAGVAHVAEAGAHTVAHAAGAGAHAAVAGA